MWHLPLLCELLHFQLSHLDSVSDLFLQSLLLILDHLIEGVQRIMQLCPLAGGLAELDATFKTGLSQGLD